MKLYGVLLFGLFLVVTIVGFPQDNIKVVRAPGEPDNSKENVQCTMLQNGTLANVQCTKTFPYVCFREKTSDHHLEPCGTVDKLYSLDNRTRSCYKFHRECQPWSQANMTCMAEGGYLAIINDAIEAEVIKEIFAKNPSNTIVSGCLKDVAAVGFLDMGERKWITIHGQSLSEVYSNFGKTQPDNIETKCGGIFRHGRLDDIPCNIQPVPFICEKDPEKALAECHIYRHDYVYISETGGWMKYHRVPDTFPSALLRCIAEGAILASPTDLFMREAMLALNKANGESCGIFTGIHAIFSKGDYSTVDGFPLDKIKVTWAPGEPVNSAENQQCTAMGQNGTLATVQCNETFPYICFREKTNDHPLEPCGTVDKLYSLDNRTRSCYKFHRVGLTWRQAYMTSMAEGGYLAIINDAMEAEVIKEIFAKNPRNTIVSEPIKDIAAVGFLDMGERNWITIHGQSLSEVYSIFDKNQPDMDAQKCGGVFRNGLLDNIGCTGGTMPFICEKHPDSLKDAGAYDH